jgi:hypothetical protein
MGTRCGLLNTHVGVTASQINLVTASLDLQLVQLLRSAMNPGTGPAGSGNGITPQPTIHPRHRHDPQPVIEPRKHIVPEPHFEPRRVHHPEPAFAPRTDTSAPPLTDAKAECAAFLQPPWKTLPWRDPLPPSELPKIKVVMHRPDTIHKGSLIDFFI